MSKTLEQRLIRLGNERPDLREHLGPILDVVTASSSGRTREWFDQLKEDLDDLDHTSYDDKIFWELMRSGVDGGGPGYRAVHWGERRTGGIILTDKPDTLEITSVFEHGTGGSDLEVENEYAFEVDVSQFRSYDEFLQTIKDVKENYIDKDPPRHPALTPIEVWYP